MVDAVATLGLAPDRMGMVSSPAPTSVLSIWHMGGASYVYHLFLLATLSWRHPRL